MQNAAMDEAPPEKAGQATAEQATAAQAAVEPAVELAGKLAGETIAETSAADPIAEPVGEPVDILVAEDNEVNCIVFSQILAGTDWNWAIVRDGAAAVAAFKERRPALILMDVSMPVMNGLEATAAIRRIEAGLDNTPRTPIIGVTAHALKGDMERCLEAGMDDYLTKPVSPQGLAMAVEKWLAREQDRAKRA